MIRILTAIQSMMGSAIGRFHFTEGTAPDELVLKEILPSGLVTHVVTLRGIP